MRFLPILKPRSMKKYKSVTEVAGASRADSMDESSSNSTDQPVVEHLKEHNQNYGENKFLVGSSSFKRKSDENTEYKKKVGYSFVLFCTQGRIFCYRHERIQDFMK